MKKVIISTLVLCLTLGFSVFAEASSTTNLDSYQFSTRNNNDEIVKD